MHSVLASRFHGLDVVEIGTHGGDGMNCFAQVAKSAVAIELDPRPCELLRERAKLLLARGRELVDELLERPERLAAAQPLYLALALTLTLVTGPDPDPGP